MKTSNTSCFSLLLTLAFTFCSTYLYADAADIGGGGSCIAGSDILFIIDDSGSVSEIEYAQMQSSIVEVGNQLLTTNSNHRIASMHFGGPQTDYLTGGQHIYFERNFSNTMITDPVRQFGLDGAYNADWTEDYLAGALLNAGWGLDADSSTTDPYIISPLKELARRKNKALHILIFTDMNRNLADCCSSFIDRNDSGFQPDDGSEFTIYNVYKSQDVTLSVVGFNLTDEAKAAAAAVSSFGGSYGGTTDPNPSDPESVSGDKRLILADPASFSLTPAQVAETITHANCGTPDSDISDAPASYGIASHIVPASPTVYLGTIAPDKDANELSSSNADGDDNSAIDDEDGVNIPALAWDAGTTESLTVTIQGNGYLNAWMDWNLDGDFDDSGEQISNEMAVATGTANIIIAIPGSAVSGNIPSRFRYCSTLGNCNTPIGEAPDGEVEDYLIEVVSCSTLSGDVSEIAAGIPLQITTGDQVFVSSNSPAPEISGHLKAYAVLENGSINATVAWDAATLMNTINRQARLYSTNNATPGIKILFNALDDPAFTSSGSPSVTQIKQYTIDPSINSGTYLAGRASGSFLGPMSRGNDVTLLTQMNNMGRFLTDSAYRNFYNSTVASRSEKILVSSDDGFLYAFDQSTGEIVWGWMPRSLVTELKNYTGFQGQRLMRGNINIIDAKDASGVYASYVAGSYKDGLGHYVLKLDSNGELDTVVFDEDHSSSFNAAPNHGEMDYFRDTAGLTYITYVVTNNSNQSTLMVRDITNATASSNRVVALSINATSVPFVIQNFNDVNGPAARTLYLGDQLGNIRRTPLLDNSGNLNTEVYLKTSLESSLVGDLDAIEPVLFLGASNSSADAKYYLRAQSLNRLTLLDYNTSTSNWDKRWTSYVGGSGRWNAAGSYTPDNSGAASIDADGFYTVVSDDGVQWLPTNARITDAAQIAANAVVLPVTVQTAGSCIGNAHFYLYNLPNGVFPDQRLMKMDASNITGNIALGYGDAARAQISDVSSQEYMIGYGTTDLNKTLNNTIDSSFLFNDVVSTGIRGWKERRQE